MENYNRDDFVTFEEFQEILQISDLCVNIHCCLDVRMAHHCLYYFNICFIFAEPRTKSMAKMMAGKVRNNNRLTPLFLCFHHFLSIIAFQDSFNRSINRLWIMDIPKTITEYESCHTIYHCAVEAILFLCFIFLLKSLIHCIHLLSLR